MLTQRSATFARLSMAGLAIVLSCSLAHAASPPSPVPSVERSALVASYGSGAITKADLKGTELVVVLNGVKIGANCLVGAGALLTEGKTFPDDSMILGAPAKAVRATDDQMRAMIARAANVYVKRWKRYAAGLKRLG